MQVKKTHISPYKYSKLYIDEQKAASEKQFVKWLSEATDYWSEGTYILKHPDGLFAKFDRVDKKIKLHRRSENTGKQFLCWEHFN